MNTKWNNIFTSSLNALSRCIEFEFGWSEKETIDKIFYFNEEFPAKSILSINPEVLNNLLGIYQNALDFKIYQNDYLVFDLNEKPLGDKIKNLKKHIREFNFITLDIKINKNTLIDIYFPFLTSSEDSKEVYILFIFQNAIERILTKSSLSELESSIWNNNKSMKPIILIPEFEISLHGEKLEIIGGKHLENFQADSNLGIVSRNLNINTSYDDCRSVIKWQEKFVDFLTPWHFYLIDKTESTNPIKNIIKKHFMNLFLLFTADISFYENDLQRGVITSRYLSENRTCEISHIKKESETSLNDENISSAINLLNWAYDKNWNLSDRLSVVQIEIVETLANNQKEKIIDILLERIHQINDNVVWYWKSMMQEKISDFYNTTKMFDEFCNVTFNKISENLLSMQKSLTENVLAAIGILVGSIVATLLDINGLNEDIIKYSLWIYAAYLFIFALCYNMSLYSKKFKIISEQIEKNIKKYKSQIPKEKVEELIDIWQIESIKKTFVNRFFITIILFEFIIFFTILASKKLPELF